MALRFRVALVVLVVAAMFIAGASWHLLTHIDTSTSQANAQTAKLNKVVGELHIAEVQRECDSVASSKAFGAILSRLADNFATAPAPDPGRLQAVAGLRSLATAFSNAAPVPCPAAH